MSNELTWAGPVIGAVIAFIGVGLTQFFTMRSRRQDRQWEIEDEKRNLTIQRGEELYSLVQRWWLNQIQWYSNCKLCMQGDIDYNTFLDRYIQQNEGVDLKLDRIKLIFSIYFRDIENKWNKCIELIQVASAIERGFKQEYKEGVFSGKERLPAIQVAMLKADNQIEITLASIATTIRQGGYSIQNDIEQAN